MADDRRQDRRWLRTILAPLRANFREVLITSLFVNLLGLAVPVFVLQVYDRVVFFSGFSTLQGLVVGVAFALAFDYMLRQSRSRMLQRVALRIDATLGRRLFAKVLALPLRTLEGRPAAHWQSLFRDVDAVRNTFSGATAVLLTDLPFAVLFLGFVLIIAAPVAWVLFLVTPAFVLLAWASGRAARRAGAREREAGDARERLVAELVAGRTTVKALALDDAIRPVWEDRHAETIERALERGTRADNFLNLGLALTMATTVLLTTVGALAIIDQRLTIGALIATNMIASRIINPFQQLVAQWRSFAASRQAVRRLSAVFAEAEDLRESAVRLDRLRGEITVEGVRYAYGEGEKPAIDGIGIRIGSPGLHAILGPNGSGKTTLLKLIQGLYRPDVGRILLDGADISQYARREVARRIGYVPQECFLFAGTVRDNIAKGYPRAGDQEIVAAARLAGLHDFVINLPEGYGTDIGEAGQRLSGGIRQRLIIARALVGDPLVLLLDEPSTSLDRQAEDALRDTLLVLAAERNVVVVTHSPVLLAACRNILVLEGGRITAGGPAAEMLPRLLPDARPQAVAGRSA